MAWTHLRLKTVLLSASAVAILFFGHVYGAEPTGGGDLIKVKARPPGKPVTPFTLFFDPEKNGVRLEKQQIDYDLTTENALRVGPYFLSENDVAMYLTKEHGEYYEVEFGLEVNRRVGPLYVASFRWPADYLDFGLIELQDDKGQVLWSRNVVEKDVKDWKNLLEERKRAAEKTPTKNAKVKITGNVKPIPEKLNIMKPDTLSQLHSRSEFGFAYKGVLELPVNQIVVPFRFCISKEVDDGRIGLCSRRYQFYREYGNYGIRAASGDVRPRVLVNDKPVTMKGTALFLDLVTPVKFSAMLKSGTYYEFVARPKEIHLVDMIEDKRDKKVEIIGYGDAPVGDVEKDFYRESMLFNFLNFMPTIGDMRKFWRITVPSNNPTIYLKGYGGVPFRQSFTYAGLPSKSARLEMPETSQKATYNETPELHPHSEGKIKLGDNGDRAKLETTNDVEWEFRSPELGQINVDDLEVIDDGKKFKASYQMFRGFPAEISGRTTGVLSRDQTTKSLSVIALGEVAGQYWFEKILGWDNYYFSKLRWGMSLKYFDTLAAKKPSGVGFVGINVATVDLKYRLDPGIWARDPTVGLIFAAQQATYQFRAADFNETGIFDYTSKATMAGGGVFWARSMPKVFDDIFNIVPFMRYPKWVDVEGILYPLSLSGGQQSYFTLAVNFHGKIQWTPRFFGEAGFGLKNYSWADHTIDQEGKSVGLALGYATVGLGLNF